MERMHQILDVFEVLFDQGILLISENVTPIWIQRKYEIERDQLRIVKVSVRSHLMLAKT